MRAAAILVVFFLLFTLISIAVSVPLFPGNMVHVWFRGPTSAFAPYVEAIANGLVYGFVTWIVFFMASRRIDKALLNACIQNEPAAASGKKTLGEDLSKKKNSEKASTEQRQKPALPKKSEREHAEMPERRSPPPNKTKKTEVSRKAPNPGCPNNFGYLSKHPKNTRIPNQCLTCTMVLECMSQSK